ncbi:WD repeat-containing protein [Fusarium beomiforme]|uniref:WD repeat-containing protein n=1 Tax=Fusarium beomiforme TaxID=44412 RepID=A0A9P5AMF0_9HYPO|nr:WD repeat-containing protein [Fusarium beomiforme]
MSAFKYSPAVRGERSLSSRRDSAVSSLPESESQRRQSLAARSDSQGAGASLDLPSSRLSTTQPSVSGSQNAKETKDWKPPFKSTSPSPPPNAGLDPLSTQIYLRTNSNTAEPTIAQRILNQGRSDSPAAEDLKRQSSELSKSPNTTQDSSKDRRKGVSFLSRLGMRGSWRKDDDMQESDSELGELRTEGTYARALTSVIGAGGGYIPLHKEPPRYIRVKAHNKKDRDYNHLFLAQELTASEHKATHGRAVATAVGSKILRGGDAIWAAEFSLDGRYLAVAGKDQIVRVFAVISTPEERKAHEEEEAQNGTHGEKLSAPVFRTKPVREFKGHTGEVLALSWSKNNFLLSSSMDKTVKLWHMSRSDCLCTFVHKDLVTSIAFHPKDDRFFLAGSLDAQLRLWSIPDKSVAFQAPVGEFITAVAFSPDGSIAICGVLSGLCSFHTTEGLKLKYQIHVRSSRGKNAKGSKITGIRTMTVQSGPEAGIVKVLITSNDSRVRVYNLNDKVIQVKYKGLENQSSQINARFSDDGSYIICGSEDRKAYIWKLGAQDEIKDKQPYETFDAHPEVVTTALMAPAKSRQLLSASGDPIYDLCNPPPVMLRSLEESTPSQSALSDEDHGDSLHSNRRPEETPAYIERSKHFDGNIIITTDRTGKIKVFRQDCAHKKRQQGLWESGSRLGNRLSGVGRSGSVMTRTSASSRAQSRRGSLNIPGPNPIQLQHASDRINSWRQDVDGGRPSLNNTPARSERSMSPTKPGPSPINSAANLTPDPRSKPLSSNPVSRPTPTSPASSGLSNRTTVRASRDRERNGITSPPTPSFSLISASDSEGLNDREGSFWTLSRWRSSRQSLRNSSMLNTPTSPNGSPNPGLNRPGSQFLSVRERSSPRMSLGIDELKPPRQDVANRRRSAGPRLTSRLSVQGDEKHGFEDQIETHEEITPSKKRVDSGVGRISDESADSIIQPY